MRIVVVGAGAVGARVARQLVVAGDDQVRGTVQLVDPDAKRAQAVATSLGQPARVARDLDAAVADGADVVVLACPGPQRRLAEKALDAGAHVVSTTDDPRSATALLDLDAEARERNKTVVVGAGFMPGLTDVLARHAAADLTAVEEIHVAKAGTGGPACARQHHWALAAPMREWRDSEWVERNSGSGRELCWFPDPLGGLDCYRAALPDPVLLHAAFPSAIRVTARVAATRRDRITAHLPMLRRPHAEGRIGAIRVEVRGWRGAVADTRVLGVLDRPAVATGCVAAVTALWIGDGRLARPGASGLGLVVTDPIPFLSELGERGVRAAIFEGHAAA
ncbi:MAG TPA: Gfo/Idh/MocA family oxidoreductase [Acidimicrobiales bacterium]|jgi:saccharopine dehydrogenase-like NADP-dependent oxidoreductase|nr:Gfo/Idh/MocA family oxidoreductase [Acidimicrobiales bacterium]